MSSGKLLTRRSTTAHKTVFKQIMRDAPSVYFPMQETSGTIVDVIAALPANPSGTPTYGEAAPWGKSIRLSGTQWFEINASSLFNLADNFSMSVWFKMAAAGTQLALFSRRGTSPTNTGWVLRHESTNKMRMFKSQTGLPDGTGSTSVSDTTTWHHLVGVKPAGTGAPYLYLDGVLETMTGQLTGQYVTAANSLTELIGADRDWTNVTTDKFNGWLAHLALFPGVLSAARVLAQYNSGH